MRSLSVLGRSPHQLVPSISTRIRNDANRLRDTTWTDLEMR